MSSPVAGLLVASVGIFFVLVGSALVNADTLERIDDVAGVVCITLGLACVVSGLWALSGGA